MFTNPLNRKYQAGGSAPTDDQKKDMQGFVTWIKSNVEGFKDKSEQEIAKSLSDMAKSDEGKKSVQDLYSRYQKSKKQKSKFADGGKFQDFICKHGRGGNVDCGCGGMVIRGAEGIDDIPTPKDSTVTSNGYVIYKPSVREVAPNGESVVITYGHDPNGQWARRMEWANGSTSILGGYNNNGKWVSDGDIILDDNSKFGKAFLSPKARMSGYENRPQSKEDGGILKGQQGLSRATGYYQRHANEGIIRKLQNFLMGRGYYNGDLDGKFGNQTYEAIRQYQRDNGLTDDGMWGEDTNEVHRVLGAGDTTFNGPRSGAHPGRHTYGDNFVNRSYQTASKVSYGDINKAIERAISDPEWFMGDTEDAKNWRILFMKKNPDGSRIFDQIYDSDPEFFGQSRFSKKLPTDLAIEGYQNEINTARDRAARIITPILAAPVALANPVATATSIGGGLVGASLGHNVGSDMKRAIIDKNGNLIGYQGTNSRTIGSHTDIDTPLVTPDRSNDGEIIGGTIGAIAGSAVPETVESLGGIKFDARYNPTGVEQRLQKPLRSDLGTVKPRVRKPKTTKISEDKPKTKRTGDVTNFWGGKNADQNVYTGTPRATSWFRRLTGQPINDSEVSGYFIEKQGGQIEKHQNGNNLMYQNQINLIPHRSNDNGGVKTLEYVPGRDDKNIIGPYFPGKDDGYTILPNVIYPNDKTRPSLTPVESNPKPNFPNLREWIKNKGVNEQTRNLKPIMESPRIWSDKDSNTRNRILPRIINNGDVPFKRGSYIWGEDRQIYPLYRGEDKTVYF